MIYNFNVSPRCGKTYYEINKSWRYLKQHIKQILDEKDSSREYKIDMIICMLEDYKQRYLTSKGENK